MAGIVGRDNCWLRRDGWSSQPRRGSSRAGARGHPLGCRSRSRSGGTGKRNTRNSGAGGRDTRLSFSGRSRWKGGCGGGGGGGSSRFSTAGMQRRCMRCQSSGTCRQSSKSSTAGFRSAGLSSGE